MIQGASQYQMLFVRPHTRIILTILKYAHAKYASIKQSDKFNLSEILMYELKAVMFGHIACVHICG